MNLWPLPGFKPRFLERPAHRPVSTPTVLSPPSIACGNAIIALCIHNLLSTSEVPNLCSVEPRPLQENKINKN